MQGFVHDKQALSTEATSSTLSWPLLPQMQCFTFQMTPEDLVLSIWEQNTMPWGSRGLEMEDSSLSMKLAR